MKTVKISAIVLAMAGVFATSANAQSAKTNAWEGFYGQVGVGYGTVTPTIKDGTATIPAGFGGVIPVSLNATTSGQNVNTLNTAVANIAAGYNFAINDKFVVGLGVSYDPGASSGATGQLVTRAPTNPALGPLSGAAVGPTQNATYQMKNVYSITVNPGYTIDNDKLAYLMLGYTGATVGLSSQNIPYNTVNLTGYTVGLGYKQMITQSLYMLGEVKYASYGQKTANATAYGVVPVAQPVSANGAELLVGVGYRF
jgi:hypothetical protein